MSGKMVLAAVSILVSCLATGGCMVTSSKYEMKTKEADTLRDAVATANKEKTVLQARIEALQKQLADAREAEAELSARLRTQEEEINRFGEELASARRNYEGTRITREQFISELLEKEKSTGKRIQELSLRAQACESELAAQRGAEGKPGEYEALKRERDTLLGRVERLTEEHKLEDKRRDERFASLAESIRRISRNVPVASMGPSLSVDLPENMLVQKGKNSLSEGGRKVIAEVGKAAAEFPTASVIVITGGRKLAGDIKSALADTGKIPQERILPKLRDKEKGAELLLLVP